MLSLSSRVETEHFTCCNFAGRNRVVYDDDRFVTLRTSWFSSFCCSCCERIETNARAWNALRRMIRDEYGGYVEEHCFADSRLQTLMKKRRDLTEEIFQHVIRMAKDTQKKYSPTPTAASDEKKG